MTDRKNHRLYEHFGQNMLLRIGLCRLKKKEPPGKALRQGSVENDGVVLY
jgi:hypothetical protein